MLGVTDIGSSAELVDEELTDSENEEEYGFVEEEEKFESRFLDSNLSPGKSKKQFQNTNRMMKILMSDGLNTFPGIEYKKCVKLLNLATDIKTLKGKKILIKAGTEIN